MKKRTIKLLWEIAMTAFYIGMASLLTFSDIFNIGKGIRIIIAILFFAYGVFRGYRVWKTEGSS